MAEAKIDWGNKPDETKKRRYRILRGSFARQEPNKDGTMAFVHYSHFGKNELTMTDKEANAFPGGRKNLVDVDANGKLVRPSPEQIKYMEEMHKLQVKQAEKGKDTPVNPFLNAPSNPDAAGETA